MILAYAWRVPRADAVTKTWDGSSGTGWETAGNWNHDLTPVLTAPDLAVVIAGSANMNQFLNSPYNATWYVNSYTFQGTASHNLNGTGSGGPLFLSIGSAAATFSQNSASTATISPNSFTLGSDLTVGGTGSGTVTFGNGGPSGNYGLIKNGSFTLLLNSGGTFTGPVTIHAGTAQVGSLTGLGPAASARVVFGSGSTGRLQTGTGGQDPTINGLNSSATVGTPIVENGTGSGRTLTINTGNANTFAGTVQNGGAASLALVKAGNGSLALTGTNTFTGTVTVNGGILALSGTNSATAYTLSNSGSVLKMLPGVVMTASADISMGSGTILDLNGQNVSIDGLTSGSTGSEVLTTTNTSVTLTIGNSNDASSPGAYFRNGRGYLGLTKNGTGTIVLSGTAPAWQATGPITINNGRITFSGGSMGSTSTVNIVSGSISLNGSAQQFESIIGGGLVTTSGGLTIGMFSGEGTFGGNIDGGTITKNMGGTYVFTNAISANTVMTVNGGILAMTSAGGALASASSYTVNYGAKLQMDNSAANNNNRMSGNTVTLNGGTLEILGNAGATTTETIGNISVNNGAVTLTATGAGNPVNLNIGTFTRSNQGTISVSPPAAGGIVTSSGTTDGIYGGWATVGNDWATRNVTASTNTIVALGSAGAPAYTGAMPLTGGANTENRTVSGTQTQGAASAAKTIKITTTGGGQSLSTATHLLTLGSGGILFAGGDDYTLTSSGAGQFGADGTEVIVWTKGAGVVTANANLTGGGGSLVKAGTNTLILGTAQDYSGTTTINEGTLRYSAADRIAGGNLVVNGGTFDLQTFNESLGAVTLRGGAISGSGTSTLTAGGAWVVEDGSISARIAGSQSMTKNNAWGTVTLSGDNATAGYSGSISISASGGILRVGHGGALGTTGASTSISSGGVLEIVAGLTVNEPISVVGTGIGGTGAIRVRDSGSDQATTLGPSVVSITGSPTFLAVDRAGDTLTLTGTLSASGQALNKIGAGTLVLNAASAANMNATVIYAGTVRLGASSQLNAGANVTIYPGATLDLNGFNQRIQALSGYEGSSILLGAGTLIVDQNSAQVFRGVISGTGGIVKTNNTSTLTFTGANTYSGNTELYNGALQAGADEVIPDGAGKGNLVLQSGTFDLQGNTETINGLTGTANDGVINCTLGTGLLIVGNTNATSTFQGNFQDSVANARLQVKKVGTGTLSLTGSTGNSHEGMTTVSAGTLDMNKAVPPAIATGGLTVGEDFAGATNATASYNASANADQITSGPIFINHTGTLDLNGKSDTIGGRITMTGGTLQTGAGTATLNGDVLYMPSAGSPGVETTANITGTLALGASRIFHIADGVQANDMAIAAIVSGSGNNITKSGAGTLLLSGVNTYSGTTTIRNGTLLTGTNAPSGASGALGNAASSIVLGDTGTDAGETIGLGIAGSWTNSRSITMTTNNYQGVTVIGGYSAHNSVFAGAITLSKNIHVTATNSGTATFMGAMTGSFGVSKVGAGTVRYAGTDKAYTGPTVISNGTLRVDNNLASGVTVADGGTLSGTGRVTSVVYAAPGGHVAPGSSIGVLSNATLHLANGSFLDFEFKESGNPSNDQIVVTSSGGLVISNTVAVNLTYENATNHWSTNGTYYLISYVGALGGGGVSALYVTNGINGKTYAFGTVAGTPNWITLTISGSAGPSAPAITTLAATNVLTTSAYLNGNLTSTGAVVTTARVYYGLADGGTAYAAWSATNDFGGQPTGALSVQATGLTPSSVYYYRYYATNSVGENWGAVESFSTAVTAPSVTSLAASAVTNSSANLNGNLVTNGNATTQVRVYLTAGSDLGQVYTGWLSTNTFDAVTNSASLATNVTGLSSLTQYVYRYYATNSMGESWGAPVMFNTVAPPPLTRYIGLNAWGAAGSNPLDMAPTSAAGVVVASTNWNNFTNTLGAISTIRTSDGLNTGMGATWSGFEGGYRARLSATNGHEEMMWGYSDNTAGSATFTVTNVVADAYDVYVYYGSDADGRDGTVGINHSTATNYYKSWSATRSFPSSYTLATSTGPTYVNANYSVWSNLTASSFTLTFQNVGGNSGIHGLQIVTRTIIAAAPAISTSAATNVVAGSAYLNGSLTSTGGVPTTVRVYYGTSNPGQVYTGWTGTNDFGVGLTGSRSYQATGLAADTTYFYRYYATNGVGESWGAVQSFTTPINPGAYTYKMRITFPGYTQSEILTNFPALVLFSNNIHNSTFDYAQFASTNGYDLRFLDNTETTSINFEVEQWNTGGVSYVWAQVPFLTNGAAIWAYWGNGAATALPACTTNGATWDSNFKGVYHLTESAASSDSRDATANGNHGTQSGTPTVVSAAQIAGGRAMTGSQKFTVGSGVDLSNKAFTLSAWARPTTVTGDNMWGGGGSANNFQGLHVGFRNNNLLFGLYSHDIQDGANYSGDVNQWHHYTYVMSGSAVKGIYRDGVKQATTGGSTFYQSTGLAIGGTYAGSTSWQGSLDEVRAEPGIERSSNWVWSVYMNAASNTTTFNNYGPVVASASPPAITTTAATNVLATTAYLNGALTSTGGVATTVRVYYHTSDLGPVYGGWLGTNDFGNTSTGTVSYLASGLSSNTAYSYRYYATNAFGEAWGGAVSFTTLATPLISNTAPTSVTAYGANANGQLYQGGSAATIVRVYYGTSDAGQSHTGWGATNAYGSGVANGALSANLSGLSVTTTYFYRYYATNVLGESWGDPSTNFTTLSFPTVIKANNATALNVGSSWVGGVTPLGSDIAIIDNTTSNGTVAKGGTNTFGRIQFTNPGVATFTVTASGDDPLTLMGVGGTGIDMSGATADLSLICVVSNAAAQAWTIATNRTLTVGSSGVRRIYLGAGDLTLQGDGNTVFAGEILASSSGGLIKRGKGTVSYTHSQNNTFTGATLVYEGTLFFNHSSDFRIPVTGPFTIGEALASPPRASARFPVPGTFNNATLASGQPFVINKTGLLDFNGCTPTIGGTWTLNADATDYAVITNTAGGGILKSTTNTITFAGGGRIYAGTSGTFQLFGNVDYTAASGQAALIAGNSLDFQGGTRTFTIGNDAGLNPDMTISATLNNGGITKAGPGTLVLSANNNNNATTISGGVLQVGVGGTTGSLQGGTGNITDNATLTYSRSNAHTHSGVISGSGAVIIDGSGTITLSGDNTFTGDVTVAQGTLVAGNTGTTDSSLGNPSVARTVTINSGATLRIEATDLWGAHMSSPTATYVAGGLLQNSTSSGVFNTLRNLTLTGGELRANGGSTSQYPAWQLKGTVTISGSSASTMTAPGSVNANTQIHIGNNTAGGITIFDVADVTGSSAADLTVANAIVNGNDGGGTAVASGLTKTGAGTMVLNGTNTYSYNTLITNGNLRVNGSLTASRVIVTNGATLSGTGLIAQSVTNGATGRIAPGSSIGTLTNGSLTLSAGSFLDFEFGSSNDKIVTTNSNGLTINGGAFSLYADGTTNAWTGVGTFDLIQYTGTISGTGISALSVTNPIATYSYTFATNGGWVQLTVVDLARPAISSVVATNITTTTAYANGTLTSTGFSATVVSVYYGTSDAGQTTVGWAGSVPLGTAAGAPPLPYSTQLTGLTSDTTYYYRYYATNAAGEVFSSAAQSFTTLVAPQTGPFRMKIIISGFRGNETLTNFPMLVVFSNLMAGTDFKFAKYPFLSSSGYDLRFQDASETTDLNYEIESWNTNTASYVWVQIPTLSTNTQYIWAKWASPAASSQFASTTNGATWDSHFRGVWHLNETSGTVLDSTTNNNDSSSVTAVNQASTGHLNGADYFNGSSSFIACSNSGSSLTLSSAVTLSGWAYVDAGSHNWRSLFGRADGSQANRGDYSLDIDSGGFLRSFLCNNGTPFTSGPVPPLQTWFFAGLTYDGTTARFVMNNTFDSRAAPLGAITSLRTMQIGRHWGDSFLGMLDEVRVEDVARSTNWLINVWLNSASNAMYFTGNTAQQLPEVDNAGGAQQVTSSSAMLCGNVVSTGSAPTQVWIYWGTNDGGTVIGNWGNSISLGTLPVGAFSNGVSGLLASQTYYYRSFASNATTTVWAGGSSNFTTLAAGVTLSVSPGTIAEAGGSLVITARLDVVSAQNVTVNLDFTGGPVRGTDYSTASTQIVVTAGSQNASMTLTGVDDFLIEGTETGTVSIASLANGTNGSPASASFTVSDDDAPPGLTNGGGASNVGATTATLNGTVASLGGSPVHVWIYYGATDGGTVIGNWASNVDMGFQPIGSFSNNVTGLFPNQSYYYRVYGTNSATTSWAPASSAFSTTPVFNGTLIKFE